ncbi:MAG TPA: GNAT family N-acetyltransferase [Pirellulales bacterium]|jgi:GNAT superfamily N-acetyltransferase
MAVVLHYSKRLSERPTPGFVPDIDLRSYQGPSDIPIWLELRHRAFARATPGILQWDRSDFANEFLEKPWWSPERIWFAITPDAASGAPLAVGTVAMADRGSGAAAVPAVHWLAVLPTWRRRGVARMLVAALEERCWRLDMREIFLETHEGWTAARRLYEELGYRQLP